MIYYKLYFKNNFNINNKYIKIIFNNMKKKLKKKSKKLKKIIFIQLIHKIKHKHLNYYKKYFFDKQKNH